MTCLAKNVPILDEDAFDYGGTLFVPKLAVESYKASESWRKYWNIEEINLEANGLYYNIIDEVNKYVEVTFQDYNSNSSYVSGSITIPSSVTFNGKTYSVKGIGEYAFGSCWGLTSVNIPNSVTSIGEEAFSESGLTSIDIPNSIINIGDEVFEYCSDLTNINIPNSVESIGRCAFAGCRKLTNIIIPNSITNIEEGVFCGCSNLASIDIPNSVTSIGNNAFASCSGLTTVNIPNSVVSIGDKAFEYCSNLTNIKISSSVTTIGYSAFANCDGLTNIDIPNSVTSIGNCAFVNCGLTSVNIGTGVTTIGYSAFCCWDLCEMTCLAENVPTLVYNDCSPSVFYGTKCSTGTLYVPESAVDAYKAADQWKDWGNIVEIKNKDYTPGDVNGDGDIDVVDVTSTISCALGDEPENFNREAADVNEDGEIDVVDVTAIISMAM